MKINKEDIEKEIARIRAMNNPMEKLLAYNKELIPMYIQYGLEEFDTTFKTLVQDNKSKGDKIEVNIPIQDNKMMLLIDEDDVLVFYDLLRRYKEVPPTIYSDLEKRSKLRLLMLDLLGQMDAIDKEVK